MKPAFALLVCTFAVAARPAAAADGRPREVELRLVRDEDPEARQGMTCVRLDKGGEASIPFANAAGKLLVRFKDGKVFLDANGDGTIDAADGEGVRPPEPGAQEGVPPLVEVAAKIAGRGEQYPVHVAFATKDFVSLFGKTTLEGKLGDATIRLIDTNVNGSFDEVGRDGILVEDGPDSAPTLAVYGARSDTLGRVVAIGGKLLNIEVTGGGAALRLTPYAGEKATLVLGKHELVKGVGLVLAHEDGLITCSAASGTKTILPAGRYKVTGSMLALRTPDDATPTASPAEMLSDGSLFGQSAILLGQRDSKTPLIVTIHPGGNELSPGPPLVLEFGARVFGEAKGQLEVEAPALVGAMGERYQASLSGAVKSTLTVSVRAGGKEKQLSKLEYG